MWRDNGTLHKQLRLLAIEAKFRVDELSTLLNISERSLRQKIQDTYGVHPNYWLNNQRAIHMRSLLRSGYTLKETAYELGFKSDSHFTKHCKKWHKATPAQLKERWTFPKL